MSDWGAFYRSCRGAFVIDSSSQPIEITEWRIWFAEIATDAQSKTTTLVDFLIAKTRLLDRLRGQLNSRQEKALLRMFREGPKRIPGRT